MRPLPPDQDAEQEGEGEHRQAGRREDGKGAAPDAAAPPEPRRPPRHHMLSGALTPSRSSPLRSTWPTAAQSANRASITARSSADSRR